MGDSWYSDKFDKRVPLIIPSANWENIIEMSSDGGTINLKLTVKFLRFIACSKYFLVLVLGRGRSSRKLLPLELLRVYTGPHFMLLLPIMCSVFQ